MFIKIKKFRVCAVVITFCMLLLVLTVGIQEEIRKESAPKAMVFLATNEQGGNGSIYSIGKNNLVIVTTYHLLQDEEVVKVIFPGNELAEGTVVGTNVEHDVGFVTVNTEDIPQETLKTATCIQTKKSVYDSLVQGDAMEYCFLEYRSGTVLPKRYQGSIGHMNWYVEDFDDYLIYNYCQVEPGMSGCAAIASDGSYLGMVIGGYENESAALSIKVIDEVYQELENLGKVNTFKMQQR